MEKPVIGITPTVIDGPKGEEKVRYSVHRDYVDRIVEAGGVPVIVPPGTDAAAVMAMIDGWLITGGDDLDAALWGEPNHESVSLEAKNRTETERAMWAAGSELPILGICYGCQFLNVMKGGSLYQHLPEIVGDDKHRGNPVHTAAITPGTRLHAIVGDQARGASSHHQAIERVGEGLQIVGRHDDGTVEAIESTGPRWMVGVQWHPERTPVEETAKLFSAFIAAAAEYRSKRLV